MKGTKPEIGLAALASGGAQTQLGILSKIVVETHVIHGTEDSVHIPGHPVACSSDIRSAVPEYPVTLR